MHLLARVNFDRNSVVARQETAASVRGFRPEFTYAVNLRVFEPYVALKHVHYGEC